MIGRLHSAQLAALDVRLKSVLVSPSPEAAFAAFLHRRLGTPLPSSVAQSIAFPLGAEERASEAPVLAIVGYALDRSPGTAAESLWGLGFPRLRKRDPLPADRAAFGYRPLELLGVSAGVRATEPEGGDATDWLRDVIERAHQRAASTWTKALLTIAADRVNGKLDPKLLRVDFDGLAVHDVAALACVSELVPPLAAQEGADLHERLAESLLDKWLSCPVEALDAAEIIVVRAAVQSTIGRSVSAAAAAATSAAAPLAEIEPSSYDFEAELVGAAALRTLPLGATAPSQHFAV